MVTAWWQKKHGYTYAVHYGHPQLAEVMVTRQRFHGWNYVERQIVGYEVAFLCPGFLIEKLNCVVSVGDTSSSHLRGLHIAFGCLEKK